MPPSPYIIINLKLKYWKTLTLAANKWFLSKKNKPRSCVILQIQYIIEITYWKPFFVPTRKGKFIHAKSLSILWQQQNPNQPQGSCSQLPPPGCWCSKCDSERDESWTLGKLNSSRAPPDLLNYFSVLTGSLTMGEYPNSFCSIILITRHTVYCNL